MTEPPHKAPGRVCLVGAGPGDPGLITVAGLQRLQQADVVIYDALASPALVAQARTEARRIDVGKRGGDHKLSQDGINNLLVETARQGGLVVRLKGGDPYLFGRGAEEATWLAEHGIACEVICGVTSGIAAPAAAGIPVTHRQYASSVSFVTGHEDPAKDQSALDYRSLAKLIAAGGTVCFYMGVGRLAQITAALAAHGLALDTPVAVVQWGTTPRQKSARGTLAKISDVVAAAGVGSPAIIVAGAVAGITDPGLDYFTRRPLFGQRIVVTRTRQQASELRRQLEELGAAVLEAPTIELAPPDSWETVDDAVAHLDRYQWLVLTSPNGVQALAERLDHLGLDSRRLAAVRIAAVGDATAQVLYERLRVRADLVPTRFVAESLAADLIAREPIAGQRFLLLRADIARPALPRLLTEAGAVVSEVVAYQTRSVAALPPDVLAALREHAVDWITFTSGSTARNLVDLLGPERSLLGQVKLASIGPITSQALREMNLAPTIEASPHDVAGLMQALVRVVFTRP